MNEPLTPVQKRVYDYVITFISEHGYPPTIRQIGGALGYASSAGVHAHLQTLTRKGYLQGAGRSLRAA